MKVSQLSEGEIVRCLRRGQLLLDLAPFVARIKSDIPALGRDVRSMYADFDVIPDTAFADFHVEVSRTSAFWNWLKPGATFKADGRPFFVPLTIGQAFACLEWGLNWCITANMHNFLILHAAVIERNGECAIMPAPPGSGKSTLCAALVMRGWRLLSDELALYDMDQGVVFGMARPVNLKNASIDIIRRFAPDAVLTKPALNTSKGTVALMRPPSGSVMRVREPARPAWIVLPRYKAQTAARMQPHSKARTLMLLAEQSFNYNIHGARGFNALADLVDKTKCLAFSYHALEDAQKAFDQLSAGQDA